MAKEEFLKNNAKYCIFRYKMDSVCVSVDFHDCKINLLKNDLIFVSKFGCCYRNDYIVKLKSKLKYFDVYFIDFFKCNVVLYIYSFLFKRLVH